MKRHVVPWSAPAVHEAKPDGFMFFCLGIKTKKMVGVVLIARKMSHKLKMVASSTLAIPTIFLPWFQGKKTWSRQASLHGTQCRFMQRKLRFIFCGNAAKCFIKNAWRWSIVSVFISLRRDKPLKLHNMKHLPSSFHYAVASHFIPLWSIRFAHMMRKWKMGVYPFAIQRYPHYIMTCNPVLYGWIFLCLDFTQRTTGIYSKSSPRQRTNRERQILCIWNLWTCNRCSPWKSY